MEDERRTLISTNIKSEYAGRPEIKTSVDDATPEAKTSPLSSRKTKYLDPTTMFCSNKSDMYRRSVGDRWIDHDCRPYGAECIVELTPDIMESPLKKFKKMIPPDRQSNNHQTIKMRLQEKEKPQYVCLVLPRLGWLLKPCILDMFFHHK